MWIVITSINTIIWVMLDFIKASAARGSNIICGISQTFYYVIHIFILVLIYTFMLWQSEPYCLFSHRNSVKPILGHDILSLCKVVWNKDQSLRTTIIAIHNRQISIFPLNFILTLFSTPHFHWLLYVTKGNVRIEFTHSTTKVSIYCGRKIS